MFRTLCPEQILDLDEILASGVAHAVWLPEVREGVRRAGVKDRQRTELVAKERIDLERLVELVVLADDSHEHFRRELIRSHGARNISVVKEFVRCDAREPRTRVRQLDLKSRRRTDLGRERDRMPRSHRGCVRAIDEAPEGAVEKKRQRADGP